MPSLISVGPEEAEYKNVSVGKRGVSEDGGKILWEGGLQ